MFVSRLLSIRTFAAIAFALIFAVATRGFAAQNTVPVSAAGDGTNTISGYAITAVAYTLNATNPQNLESVRFTVTPPVGALAPTTVKAQLTTSGAWFTCSNGGTGTTYTCAVTGVTTLAATDLRIVAAQ
jgi:hypothetical protein